MTDRRTNRQDRFLDDRTVVDLEAPQQSCEPLPRLKGEETLVLAAPEQGRSDDPLLTFARPAEKPRRVLPQFRISSRVSHSLLGVGLVAATLVAFLEHRTADSLRRRLDEQMRVSTGSTSTGVAERAVRSTAPATEPPVTPAARARSLGDGVDALAANDFATALRRFEALQEAVPEVPAYADIVIALRWKLQCGGQGTQASCP